MALDINRIKPLKGQLTCNLWENDFTGLPLTLFYSIEIPLEPFDTGHTYVEQPTTTSITMEWLKFANPITGENEQNWKNLAGREYFVSYEDDTGEGSIYLGSEHCQFDAIIKFLSLSLTTFNIELTLNVSFNIDTINLPEDGQFKIQTKVDFQGLLLYDNHSLPTIAKSENPITLLPTFVDTKAYENSLTNYDNPHVQWRYLKPKT